MHIAAIRDWRSPVQAARSRSAGTLSNPPPRAPTVGATFQSDELSSSARALITSPRKNGYALVSASIMLLHPCGAAEGVEGRRVCPDIGERSLAHVPEFKTP